jgi:hypothetical protein
MKKRPVDLRKSISENSLITVTKNRNRRPPGNAFDLAFLLEGKARVKFRKNMALHSAICPGLFSTGTKICGRIQENAWRGALWKRKSAEEISSKK